MTIVGIYNRLGFQAPSPLLKQSPIAALFFFIVVVITLVPETTLHWGAVVAGAVIAAVATLLAALFTKNATLTHLALIVPAMDFIAIGVLQSGTPVATSPYTALVILPVLWFAAEEGRRFIGFAILGTVAMVLAAWQPVVPNVFELEIVPLGFELAVIAIAAIVINELSRQARHQLQEVTHFAEQSKKLLEESNDHLRDLATSEARVRTTSHLLRGVWNAVTEQSVIGTQLTGLIDVWNPGASKMLGLSADEVEGHRHVNEFHLSEELLERARELNCPGGATVLNPGFSALVETARLGKADVREWTYVHGDGRHIPVELSVTARLDGSGEIAGYLFVAIDVTKVHEAVRLKDEFVGLISHELRTPLSSILGYLELLRDDDDVPLSEDRLRYLGVAERNAHRLLRLVGDLLFTAQVDSGNFHLDKKDIELAPILAACVESARPAAAAAGVTLLTELVEEIFVSGDPVRLGQACDNLISNAIKFTPKGGTVTVGLSGTQSNAVMTVEDTGMGIAEAELDKLFSRFFRATTATRNAVPGVGLGLVITRAIVRAHGGDMAVASEEGVFTRFSMTLPLLEPAKVPPHSAVQSSKITP